jgi:stage IV sporulation protein FB
VNIVIWVVLTLLLGARTSLAGLENIADPSQGFLARLAALNLFLALFNLLPAFPMDGGRVLRAVLAAATDRVTATRMAATAGQIMAFLFGFLGLMSGNVLLLLIALFIFMAAAAESSDVAVHDVARRMLAREAMITQYESLSPEDSLQAAAHALIRTTQHEFPVLDAAGNLQGFLSRDAIFSAVTSEGPAPLVADIMERDIPTIPLGAPLEKALDLLQHNPVAVAVTDSHGRMIGYITRENIGELIVLAGRRGRSPV